MSERRRHAWLQVLRGRAVRNGHALIAGDDATVGESNKLVIRSQGDVEVMLFDLA